MAEPPSPLDQPARLLAAADWSALETLLLDLEFLEAKVAAGRIRELHADLLAAAEAFPTDRPARHMLPLLAEAIARSMDFIHDNREHYRQALFQCSWNLAWWYDNPASAPFYNAPSTGWPDGAPPWETPQHPLQTLLEAWHTQRQLRDPDFVWIKSLTPPGLPLGSSFIAQLSTERETSHVCFSLDGSMLACVTGYNTVQVWKVHTRRLLVEHEFHNDTPVYLRFTNDARALWVVPNSLPPPTQHVTPPVVSVNLMFDWQTGEPRFTLKIPFIPYTRIQPSTDDTVLAVSTGDEQLYVVEIATGRELWRKTGTAIYAWRVSFSPDGSLLAVPGRNQIDLLHARTGEFLRPLNNPADLITGLSATLKFSPDGHYVAVSLMNPVDFHPLPDIRQSQWSWSGLSCRNSVYFTVGWWRTEDGQFFHSIDQGEWNMADATFSPDGQFLAIMSEYGSVSTYDIETGDFRNTFDDQSAKAHAIAFSPDGSLLAVASEVGVTLWNSALPRHVPLRIGHSMHIKGFSISPDATCAATASEDYSTLLWKTTTGQPNLRISTPHFSHKKVSLAPDAGTVAIACDDGVVFIYDTATSKRLVAWRAAEDDPVDQLVHSCDGALLATSDSRDHDICIWDARTGDLRIRLTGHSDFVDSIRFTADSSHILSTSFDTTCRLWNLQTGQQEREFHSFSDAEALLPSQVGGPVVTLFFNAQTPVRFARCKDMTVIAAYPGPIQALSPHPDGRQWTGTQGNHLIRLAMEGEACTAAGYKAEGG